jgi:putative endonuclease
MAYFCYILECSDGSYYTGWSTDPQRRLREHNAGRGARYTRSHRPVQLVYVEQVADLAAALRRERAIKALPRAKKNALVQIK